MSLPFDGHFIADFAIAVVIIGTFWWRLGRVEREIKHQNGRIGKLELWQARKKGFEAGIKAGKDRRSRERGPDE